MVKIIYMGVVKVFGWLLIVSGIMLIMLPFISGLTGFFFTGLAINPPQIRLETQFLTFTVAGAVLAIIGLMIVKPKKETILS